MERSSQINEPDYGYLLGSVPMKRRYATAIGTLVLGGIASAAELPSYEVFGFPVTSHQISVIGSTEATHFW